MNAFSDFYNPEKNQYDESGSFLNTIGVNSSLYTEALLEGQEILFACLFNHEMNPDEDECTDWKYLFQKSPKSYYYFNILNNVPIFIKFQ